MAGGVPEKTWHAVDATIVFVDISGFTQLSERLARSGRIGAEELTDAIDACFAGLLEVAYAGGGSLLKFGGDALLLVFTDTDHLGRACRAAVGMRSALRRVGTMETSAGRVELQMSVGIHRDTAHLFLVGGSHRELILTGPAATPTVAAESSAAAGEIVISGTTAPALPPASVGSPWLFFASRESTGFSVPKDPMQQPLRPTT
jgi:class 3 adenylate cyclase